MSAAVAAAVAFSQTFAALGRIGASQTGVVTTLEAVSTVVLAALVLGEPVSPGQACGGLAIVAAAVVIAWSRAEESDAKGTAAKRLSPTVSLVRRRSVRRTW